MRRLIGALMGAYVLTVAASVYAQDGNPTWTTAAPDLDQLVGQPADIASSAYPYRADRKPADNAPESWLAVMRFAGQPLNKPADTNALAVKQVLSALLWEEIRPVNRVELIWPAAAGRRPAPEELVITTLDNQGSASSWWNNLRAAAKPAKPTVSGDGTTWVYDLKTATCGLVFSVSGTKTAADYDVPQVRVLVADVWKKMAVEIEWGFDPATADRDYSGGIETYDGRLAGLRSLDGDDRTGVSDTGSWRSAGPPPSKDFAAASKGAARRGIRCDLLYMGTSKWRKVMPFTTQRDDVARTIVTVWTKSGNFSFLAGDLENGPILAPEYGFFVRRSSELAPPRGRLAPDLRVPRIPLAARMSSIAGSTNLLGWGSNSTPWFGGNPAAKPIAVRAIVIPARSLAMHPASEHDVAVGWRSPIKGLVKITGSVAHGERGGNGIEWWIAHETRAERKNLAHGMTDGSSARTIPAATDAAKLSEVAVEPGDMVSLVIGPRGAYQCDTTITELIVAEVGGRRRVWNLTADVVRTLQAGNPHADGQGHAGVWHFYCEKSSSRAPAIPSEPPLTLASQAASAQAFIKELQVRKLSTIRQQTRAREEQTWQGAVTGMCGTDLPPIPEPPEGTEPAMRVQVPSEQLTAQWNLGLWHLLRHCGKNPKNGRRWFNDHPYGVLACETYIILSALDQMGSHKAAEDGFDQWVSLPMNADVRPAGLFSEGHGCLTGAVGPGGTWDIPHAFGPGAIGWALVEHYWLTRDAEWLKASAPRIKANVEWMLRQRRTVQNMVPGGERMWCKGLQPAMQMTPDAGGLFMQYYSHEAYYWVAVAHFAEAVATIDPSEGARLMAEAEAYRKDLLSAVDRSVALSPVVPVRDGTYHSVIPFGCHMRGLGTGAWGWMRDGSGGHWGPLTFETDMSSLALVSPARLLSPDDVRVQGYFDVQEDRLLLENPRVNARWKGDWFLGGWHHQVGHQKSANAYLEDDDIPVFLRSFLNGYAIHILPKQGYTFNEHTHRGPPDKIFEEAAFLERFRNLLVMEEGQHLWLARATPRAWLEQGKKIGVKNAPTHFGTVDYEIVSDVDNGKINATVKMPIRNPAKEIWLRLRHPKSTPIKSVTVNGKEWKEYDVGKEVVKLSDLKETVRVEVKY